MKRILHALREEHRLIERAAACLDHIAAGAQSGRGLDLAAARLVLDFLGRFGNEAHQRKEECVLFPALLEQGLLGPRIGELLLEHFAERQFLQQLQLEVERAARGVEGGEARLALLGHEYARDQIEHAAKENRELLPIAAEQLDPAREDALLARFAAIDAEAGLREFSYYDSLLEALARRVHALPPLRPSARERFSARLDELECAAPESELELERDAD